MYNIHIIIHTGCSKNIARNFSGVKVFYNPNKGFVCVWVGGFGLKIGRYRPVSQNQKGVF